MPASLLGVHRLDRSRPLIELQENITGALGEGSSVLWRQDDLVLASSGSTRVKSAERGGVHVAVWGLINGCLATLPDGLPGDDPRALLHLYQEHGEDFARRINGHFAIMLWDQPRGLFLLIQDRFPGIVTVYWHEHDGLLVFSDRIEPLVRLYPGERERINDQALHQFLTDTYISAPHTIYTGVRQVQCGEMIRVSSGEVKHRTYDGWRRPDEKLADPKLALTEYRRLLDNAIGDWLARDPACGFLLSGGLDSSVNVALASRRSARSLPTFGIAATQFHTDAPYARRVAVSCGASYTEKLMDGSEVEDLPRLVWEMENPFFEPGMLLSWNALRLASEHVGSVVGGETADQLFGACAVRCLNRYRERIRLGPLLRPWLAMVRGFARLPLARGSTLVRKTENRLVGKHDPAYWCGSYGFRHCDLPALLRRPLPEEDRYDPLTLPDTDLDALFDFGCTVLNRDYALNGILLVNGRLGDMLGLATFSPYCDRRVADHILSLTTELRCLTVPGRPGEFVFKALHRQLAAELLEPDIIDRPKQGGAINPLIHLLDETRLNRIRRALLGSDFLGELCRRPVMADLFNDVPHNATRIMQLVALDLWHHLFVENSPAGPPDFTLTDFLDSRAAGKAFSPN